MPATKNGGTTATSTKAPEASPFSDTMGVFNALPGASMNMGSISTLTQLNAHMMMRLLDINRQYMDFITRRLDKDIALSEKLANDTAPNDMIEHLSTFYQTAFEDYSQETAELLKNSSDATSGAILEAESEATRAG